MYFTAMTFSIFWSLLDSVGSSSLFTVLLTFLHEAHRRQINTLDSSRDTCHGEVSHQLCQSDSEVGILSFPPVFNIWERTPLL